MSRFFRTRDGSSIDLLGVAAMVLVLFAFVFVAAIVAPAVALYRHPPAVSTARRNPADALRKFHDSTDHQTRLVDGRSWFFEPHPPSDKPTQTATPRVYGGPTLIAFINGTAYFADGQKISIAEPKSKTLKLIRANPPWTITVQWEGAEFPVDLFKRTDILSLKDGSGFFSSFPAPLPRAASTSLSGRELSDRSGLPPEAHRGPGADPSPPPIPAGVEVPSLPPPASDPASPPSGAPAPTTPPAPGVAPPVPPSSLPPAPTDPHPEPAPQPESTHPSKP